MFRDLAFDPSILPFDHATTSWTILEEGQLYSLASTYVAEHLIHEDVMQSFHSYDLSTSNKTGRSSIEVDIALGRFYFRDTRGHVLFALLQSVGEPVGTDYGVKMMKSLVLFDLENNGTKRFVDFLQDLVDLNEATDENSFKIFNWNVRCSYWNQSVVSAARPLDSVVLPQVMKDKLMADILRFLDPKTRSFFAQHGIPYRRSYLFWGVPGSGKTSLIQAIAGHIKRNVCFLQPTHPDINDDSLRDAVQQAPKDSIIVLEDIDALFEKDRKAKTSTPLTFSGLLNALDGVGSPMGQIFVLTTNLRDQLDSALIRNGRVDMHVEFTNATVEQMQRMWTSFYPQAEDSAEEFGRALMTVLEGRELSTASLQHFFVAHMMSSAEEALASVGDVVEEIKLRESDAASSGAKDDSAADDKNSSGRTDEEAGSDVDGDESQANSVVHVHVHNAAWRKSKSKT
jgi:chaperone BCS1